MATEMSYNGVNLKIGDNCNISSDSIIGVERGINNYGTIIIGNNVTIESGVIIKPFNKTITIMDNVYIGYNSIIYGGGNVQIKTDTIIGNNVHIYAQNPSYYKNKLIREQKQNGYGIWICEDCFIGSGSIILDGVHIVKGNILGAGSVLTQSMKHAYEVWAGNPANFIKKRPTEKNLPFAENHVEFPKIEAHIGEQKTPVKYPEEPPHKSHCDYTRGYKKV